MSRAIKFRVWSRKEGTWEKWFTFLCGDGYLYQENYQGVDPAYDQGNYVIQQFTGLLDSNNKEIYEGDILKVPNRDTLYKVVYYEYIASFQFLPIDYDVDVMTFRMRTNYNNYIANMRMTETYSIIGNIFENPELLAAV